MKDRAWLELSRPALAHNVALLRAQLPQGCDLMAVVKGNAYGHGLPATALELCRLGVHDFCVATAEEGAEMRAIQAALLRHGALGAAMSGSGPTVFGLFDDSAKADRAAEALRGTYRQTYLAAPVKKFGETE